jgi:hypothetical protein
VLQGNEVPRVAPLTSVNVAIVTDIETHGISAEDVLTFSAMPKATLEGYEEPSINLNRRMVARSLSLGEPNNCIDETRQQPSSLV